MNASKHPKREGGFRAAFVNPQSVAEFYARSLPRDLCDMCGAPMNDLANTLYVVGGKFHLRCPDGIHTARRATAEEQAPL